jgi:hypothetical protein
MEARLKAGAISAGVLVFQWRFFRVGNLAVTIKSQMTQGNGNF